MSLCSVMKAVKFNHSIVGPNSVSRWMSCHPVNILFTDECMYVLCLQAMIALHQVPGWWQCDEGSKEMYPMDYYAKDGGSWNSTWQQNTRIKAKA